MMHFDSSILKLKEIIINIFNVFINSNQRQICIISFFSAIPLVFIYALIFSWLEDENIDLSLITTFGAARIFYSLKFLWSPFIDQLSIPLLRVIGHKKSWMLLCTIIISIIFFLISNIKPKEYFFQLYFLTMLLGFLSATFDILIDAIRIETFSGKQQPIGVASSLLGYRIGNTLAFAGGFYIADIYNWRVTFFSLSVVFFIASCYVLCMKEEKYVKLNFSPISIRSWKLLTIYPFYNFFKRNYSVLILIAIILFRLGESFLGIVTNPFFLELGFSKSEIALVVKIFGIFTTVIGTYLGIYIVNKFGYFKGLMINGIAQSLTNIFFIYLNHKGYNIIVFTFIIILENTTTSMGNAALISYLSYLCDKRFLATQYIFLSSASGLINHTIVIYAGSLVNFMGWDKYFVFTIILSIPGLVTLYYLNKKVKLL